MNTKFTNFFEDNSIVDASNILNNIDEACLLIRNDDYFNAYSIEILFFEKTNKIIEYIYYNKFKDITIYSNDNVMFFIEYITRILKKYKIDKIVHEKDTYQEEYLYKPIFYVCHSDKLYYMLQKIYPSAYDDINEFNVNKSYLDNKEYIINDITSKLKYSFVGLNANQISEYFKLMEDDPILETAMFLFYKIKYEFDVFDGIEFTPVLVNFLKTVEILLFKICTKIDSNVNKNYTLGDFERIIINFHKNTEFRPYKIDGENHFSIAQYGDNKYRKHKIDYLKKIYGEDAYSYWTEFDRKKEKLFEYLTTFDENKIKEKEFDNLNNCQYSDYLLSRYVSIYRTFCRNHKLHKNNTYDSKSMDLAIYFTFDTIAMIIEWYCMSIK